MKKTLSVLLCLAMVFSCSAGCLAADTETVNSIIADTVAYIYNSAANPQVDSTGGEWAVIGLARSGADIPEEYYQRYYNNAEKYVIEHDGILHGTKYTEYSRMILALTAIGKNPADVAGYSLLTPLGDYENTVRQGINGSIWALLALDSGGYEMPENADAKIQATREMYINHILENQTSDGGWALSGDTADPDVTGMALQALAKYQEDDKVKAATDRALECMSERQNSSGGFSSWDTENSESSAQMLTALCELGISHDDARFVKNGSSIADNLLSYYTPGGGFKHTHDGGTNQMATEQGLYTMAALKRAMEGQNSLYRMSDALNVPQTVGMIGLAGKNPDVTKNDITAPGKTFSDIAEHENRIAIEALAARNIISGRTETAFEPDGTMTRAEFASIIVRGLGLPQQGGAAFCDVIDSDWFYDYINTVYFYGIVSGVSETEFSPGGTITREEAAVMTARAAALCGMDTDMEITYARDILAGFYDYVSASGWAVISLAFCCKSGIISDEAMEIKPKEAVTRAEIAQMLYNLLEIGELLQEKGE